MLTQNTNQSPTCNLQAGIFLCLTFDIETSLMWQSGEMAIAQYGIRNRQFARIFQSYLYQFLLNYHKCQCKYSENSLIITIFAVRFKCI